MPRHRSCKVPRVRYASWTHDVGIVDDGTVRIRVAVGDPLDEVVLRSYCVGAAHQAGGANEPGRLWAGTMAIDESALAGTPSG